MRLSQPAASDVTVRLTYAGTATDGSDFTAVTAVVIPAGQSSATFALRTIDDALAEGSESFTVSLGAITGGGIGLLLMQAMQTQKDWEHVAWYIVLIVMMVMLMDWVSGRIRARLIRG